LLKSNILLKARIVYAKDGPEDFSRFEILFPQKNRVERGKKWGRFSSEVDEFLQFITFRYIMP
jgi:hypothetical protein